MSQEIQIAGNDLMSFEGVKDQIALVQQVMKDVMVEDSDYGTIPGTPKKVLFKPGAEKLCQLFNLEPDFEVNETFHSGSEAGHLTVRAKCTLFNRRSGQKWATGDAYCTSLETKYRYRNANRSCPQCGSETIIKGKAEFGGGWLCWKNKGGCGCKFAENDVRITEQPVGRVEHTDPADYWNTILKIAQKRAFVHATLMATAGSGLFTQDVVEDEKPAETKKPTENEAAVKKDLAQKIADLIVKYDKAGLDFDAFRNGLDEAWKAKDWNKVNDEYISLCLRLNGSEVD